MSLLKRDNRRSAPSREAMNAVCNGLAWALDVRIDENRLDGEDQHELLALAGKCRAGAERGTARFDPGQLSPRELTRFEHLVETASVRPGLFARRREEVTLRQKAAELATRARRPSARPRWEERGAVVLPRETGFEFLRDGIFFLEHYGLLVYLLAQIENGEALAPSSYFEGDVLVINPRVGIGARFDPEGRMTPRWREILDHLVANGWFTVDTSGSGVCIARGPRAIAATKRRSS